MRILIATVQVPFIRGGAEIHAEGLRDGGPWGQGFPEPLFDGVFDGKDPEQYARSFPIHSMA